VRARATEWKLDPRRVGIMGSSAGGHLASTALTHFEAGNPNAADPVERESSRPDLGILCYAVITLGEFTHEGSKRNLLGDQPAASLVESLSNEMQVTKETPPCFIWHTWEDPAVPVENSLQFAAALRRAGVPFDLHIYQKGRHGIGLADKPPFAHPHRGRGLSVLAQGTGLCALKVPMLLLRWISLGAFLYGLYEVARTTPDDLRAGDLTQAFWLAYCVVLGLISALLWVPVFAERLLGAPTDRHPGCRTGRSSRSAAGPDPAARCPRLPAAHALAVFLRGGTTSLASCPVRDRMKNARPGSWLEYVYARRCIGSRTWTIASGPTRCCVGMVAPPSRIRGRSQPADLGLGGGKIGCSRRSIGCWSLASGASGGGRVLSVHPARPVAAGVGLRPTGVEARPDRPGPAPRAYRHGHPCAHEHWFPGPGSLRTLLNYGLAESVPSEPTRGRRHSSAFWRRRR